LSTFSCFVPYLVACRRASLAFCVITLQKILLPNKKWSQLYLLRISTLIFWVGGLGTGGSTSRSSSTSRAIPSLWRTWGTYQRYGQLTSIEWKRYKKRWVQMQTSRSKAMSSRSWLSSTLYSKQQATITSGNEVTCSSESLPSSQKLCFKIPKAFSTTHLPVLSLQLKKPSSKLWFHVSKSR
jgi:hypothetical protein